MNLYFNFFNDKDSKHFIMNSVNNSININLNKFNMKVYLSDLPFDYSEMTDVKLYIEKSSNGISVFDRYIDGSINSDTVDFSNVILDEGEGTVTYKIRLQFFNGGILFHDEIESVCTINLKTICENFTVDIFDAVKINDTYELQSFNDEQFEMKFKIKLSSSINSNGLMYNFKVYPDEEVKFDDEYKPFNTSHEYMSSILVSGSFKDNITYLHFSIKDQFGNILNEKFKITTKSGTLSLFEILNNELIIKYDEEFAVFYNSKNVDSITPYITYSLNGNEICKKSDKVISSYDKHINAITIKLIDYFELDSKFNSDLKLKFILNNDDKLSSNEMLISIDSNKPKISLANIKDGYQLVTNDTEYYTINGKLEDNNFFYIGSNQKKIDISSGKKMLYLYSKDNIKYVSFNGEKEQVLKYSNFYVIESKGYEFEVYDKDDVLINNYEYINDYYDENEKNIYFMFKQSDFSKYETNIIGKNNGFKVKGNEILPYIKKQLFSTFNDIFYLKVTLDSTLLSGVSFTKFDLGIDDLQYSFLYKVNQHTCSADLDNSKKINLSFYDTRILAVKSNEEVNVYKCNETKITNSKKTVILNEVAFTAFTVLENERIILDSNYVFFEDSYNLIVPSYVYAEPILKLNDLETSYKNYSIKELEENTYTFSLDVPIEKGINNFKLTFEDSNSLNTEVDFIIEKNKNDISIDIDETYNNYFDKSINEDGTYVLTTNNYNVIVKFIVKNESLADLKNDKYLIIKSSRSSKKQKILTEDDVRVAYINFNNFEEFEEFTIFYNDETKEISSFILSYKESIILNVNSEFVSGSNTYFLKYNVDSFANISISYPNKKMFKCDLMPNNIISITRLDNKGFLETLELEITAYDKNHLYPSVIKNVKGTFYNDSIITYSNIDDSIYKDGIIASNSFDLELHTYHKDNIEYIKYYDIHELDITKRNKYALYDKNKDCYIIRDIVTPISSEMLEVSIKIKDNDLLINKSVLDNSVKLLNDKNNFSFTYFIENNELNLKLTNMMEDDYNFSKIEFYVDGTHFFTEKNVIFNKNNTSFIHKVLLDKFNDVYTFTLKGYNLFDKVNLIKSNLINCIVYGDIDVELINFKEFCLFQNSDLKNIALSSNVDEKYIYLEVEDLFGNILKFNSKENIYNIELEQGYYCFRLIYQKFNYKKIVNSYNVEIVKDKIKLLDYTTDYLYFDKITEIVFRKQFNTSFEYLSPTLIHYCNDELVEVLSPIYEGENIRFNINKKIGINKLIYKDEFTKFELQSFEFKDASDYYQYKIFSVHTDNQTMFYNNEDEIYLRSEEDLYFKTLGITEVRTTTKKIRSIVKQKTSDYVTTTIYKEFLPCTLDFYINDVVVKSIDVFIDSNKPIRYPIFSQGEKDIQIDRKRLKLISSRFVINKDSYSVPLKHNIKHFLLNYAKGIAELYNHKQFLCLSLKEKEEFILSLGTSSKTIDELKSKISSYFKGEIK